MRTFIRQLAPAALAMLAFTLLLGVVYPLVTTGIAQVAFGDKADGSLVEHDGEVVGSSLVGQTFTSPEYFHPRPSAAGSGYDATASSGSNLGPLNVDFLAAIDERVAAYRAENGLDELVAVPVDAVTASGSGLDPHISIANAELQAARVAEARGLEVAQVLDLVDSHTDGRDLGVLGEPGVNVLMVNLALDDLQAAG
jgi:potassium-transporting ATPase KdpC subunit